MRKESYLILFVGRCRKNMDRIQNVKKTHKQTFCELRNIPKFSFLFVGIIFVCWQGLFSGKRHGRESEQVGSFHDNIQYKRIIKHQQ